ncbi:MAG: ATP synthase subunit I [Erysipelotrichaceae bacterium]|nr:ATP synthase subunit I [Erysipelotrichaceae bacterium]
MSLKIYLLTGLIALVTAGVSAFIDYKIALGILLATLFSLINLFLLSSTMKAAMSGKQAAVSLLMLGNILRYVLLVLCMFIAYKLPQYFSLIGVAIGMTLFLGALLIDAVNRRKG